MKPDEPRPERSPFPFSSAGGGSADAAGENPCRTWAGPNLRALGDQGSGGHLLRSNEFLPREFSEP